MDTSTFLKKHLDANDEEIPRLVDMATASLTESTDFPLGANAEERLWRYLQYPYYLGLFAQRRTDRADPVVDVRGAGHSGIREGSWEADRSIEMKLICSAEVADAIARHVLATYAPHYSLTLFFSGVDVVRAEKF